METIEKKLRQRNTELKKCNDRLRGEIDNMEEAQVRKDRDSIRERLNFAQNGLKSLTAIGTNL